MIFGSTFNVKGRFEGSPVEFKPLTHHGRVGSVRMAHGDAAGGADPAGLDANGFFRTEHNHLFFQSIEDDCPEQPF